MKFGNSGRFNFKTSEIEVFQIDHLNAYCSCTKGNCMNHPCHCALAKRACGPTCHKSKANQNCKRTK